MIYTIPFFVVWLMITGKNQVMPLAGHIGKNMEAEVVVSVVQ